MTPMIMGHRVVRALLILTVVSCVRGASVSNAHPHSGKVQPFKAGPPDLKLSSEDLAKLRRGETVTRQVMDKATGTGQAFAVQDISASVQTVLDRILDFNNYGKMVSGCTQSENYGTKVHGNGTQTIFTRMVIGAAMVKLEYFIHHTYYPSMSSITWTLDYNRESDLDESVGYWFVETHPERPTHARLFYSVNVMLKGWMPEFIVDILQTKALTQATAWVKFESEKVAKTIALESDATDDGGGIRRNNNHIRCVLWDLYSDLLRSESLPDVCQEPVVVTEMDVSDEVSTISYMLQTFTGLLR